ncbi:MAG TPA: DMT family transporter [Candidatus Limnocylindrales bacterium]|nr:DMT family transporter [Candidatus Limnocylindrales bacterium]
MAQADEQPQAPIVGPPLIYVVGLVTVLVLGLNWPIMTWGLETIAPLWLTSLRLLGAGLGSGLVLALTGGLRRPPRRDHAVVVSVAVVRLALVYGLVFSALLLVPPGRSSVLVHTTALWAAPIGAWLLHERLSTVKLAGLLLGIGGVVLLTEPWALRPDSDAPLGYAMLLGAAMASAIVTVHVRGHRWSATPLMLMPWQLLGAGILTTVAALAVHGLPTFAGTAREAIVVAYQIVLATGFGLWGILTLGRSLPAVSSGVLLMAVPAVGVGSSVALVGEIVTPATIAGILLVLAGVGVTIASDRRPAPVPPEGAL